MTEEEKKNVCDAAKFALNVFWKGKAHVDIINPHFFWFSLEYGKDFDADNELSQLGISCNSKPKNWLPFVYSQDFFMDDYIWEKIRNRYQSMKK